MSAVFPGFGFNGFGNQFDQAVEVSARTATERSGVAGGRRHWRTRCQVAAHGLSQNVIVDVAVGAAGDCGGRSHDGRANSVAGHAVVQSQRLFVSAGQSQVIRRNEVRNRDNEVSNRVRLGVQLSSAVFFACNLKDFILDNVGQVVRLQNQVESVFELNVVSQRNRYRRVGSDSSSNEASRIFVNVDSRQSGEVVQNGADRRLLVVQSNGLFELLLDFQFAFRVRTLFVALGAALGNVSPGSAIREDHVLIRVKRVDGGTFYAFHSVEEAFALHFANLQTVVNAASSFGHLEGEDARLVVGIEFVSLLGFEFRFSVTLFAGQLADFVDELGDLLFLFGLILHRASVVFVNLAIVFLIGDQGSVLRNIQI